MLLFWPLISAIQTCLLVYSCLPRAREVSQRTGRPQVIRAWGRQEAFFLLSIPLNSNNCVYVIRCSKCGKQYVGQTKNSIRTRLYQHDSFWVITCGQTVLGGTFSKAWGLEFVNTGFLIVIWVLCLSMDSLF